MLPTILAWVAISLMYIPAWMNHFFRYRYSAPNFVMFEPPANVSICNEPGDRMNVTTVGLSPNPPVKGDNLTILLQGHMKENLQEGSYLMVQVNKGSFRLPKIKTQACDYTVEGCPIPAAQGEISFLFEIPKMMPSGNYKIKAELYNPDMEEGRKAQHHYSAKFEIPQRLACIEGELQF
jgi:hypothetical protein